jgi:protein TonB
MKRFLVPFAIAILIHVFLLRLQGDWSNKKPSQPQSLPISLALTYVKPEATPLPAFPPPQSEVQQKPAPIIPKPIKKQPPEQPKALTPDKPPAPTPKMATPKPPKVRKLAKKIVKKETMLPTPKPEPSPQLPPENGKPESTPAVSLPPAQTTEPEFPLPGPTIHKDSTDNPLPARSDLKPDGEGQLASLTPTKGLKTATPIYRRNPPPTYPRIARRKGYEGTVLLEVLVDREGKVSDLKLFQSCGHAVLDEAAADSVRSWLFDPGTLGDEPVEMWVRVPIRFQLRE